MLLSSLGTCARMQGLPDLCTWMVRRVEAAGVCRELGGDSPILLPPRRVCGAPHATLQQSVQDWHMQIHLYGLATARPLLILQLNRFSGCHPFGRKDAAAISLEAGLIHMPCIAGGETVWMPYKIVSVIKVNSGKHGILFVLEPRQQRRCKGTVLYSHTSTRKTPPAH